MEKLDLGNVAQISSSTPRRSQEYDLRYFTVQERGRFRLSNDAFTKLGIAVNGVTVKRHESGVALLAVQEEGKSDLMVRRTATKKGVDFTNHNLRTFLDENGLEGVDNFSLVPQGEQNGSRYYAIQKWEGESPLDSGEGLAPMREQIQPDSPENENPDMISGYGEAHKVEDTSADEVDTSTDEKEVGTDATVEDTTEVEDTTDEVEELEEVDENPFG